MVLDYYNAMVHKKEDPLNYGKVFDSISICLSKGLGAPVGSVLIGSAAFIKKARRCEKGFGWWNETSRLISRSMYVCTRKLILKD